MQIVLDEKMRLCSTIAGGEKLNASVLIIMGKILKAPP